MKLDGNSHSVFLLHYPLVLVVKYRRKVFDDAVSDRAKKILEYIAPKYNITLQEWNHASVLFEYENQVSQIKPQTFLGLDFSMRELYKDSNGNAPKYPGYYRQAEKKLAREQRRLSKIQKGSGNCGKQRIKVAKLHEKIAGQRKDFLHKCSCTVKKQATENKR